MEIVTMIGNEEWNQSLAIKPGARNVKTVK
jgi:hypothetical protein